MSRKSAKTQVIQPDEEESLDSPPDGFPGTSFVVQVHKTDPHKVKESDEQEADTFFQTFGSFLVFNGRPLLNSLLDQHRKDLESYNLKLTEHKIPLRIRVYHSSVSKGRKYVYCGRYIYRKTEDGGEQYLGRLDHVVLRETLREQFTLVGPPPSNPLDGFRFIIVYAGEQETEHVIVPGNLFIDPNFNHLFNKLTVYRLA